MISMSQAGHCRMQLWLEHHALGEPEPTLPGTQRTFDLGHVVEKLFFETVDILSSRGEDGIEHIGKWWEQIDKIEDHVRGITFSPKNSLVTDRQREFVIHPFKGHIDGLLHGGNQGLWNLDIKTAGGYQWDRATFQPNLSEDIFLREYVIAQNLYVHAERAEGLSVLGSCLVFFNKEQSKLSARFLDYDEKLALEGLQRLASGIEDAEPLPDWEWVKGEEIPLRCRYCDYKQSCADTRGMILQGPVINKRGRPEWRAK